MLPPSPVSPSLFSVVGEWFFSPSLSFSSGLFISLSFSSGLFVSSFPLLEAFLSTFSIEGLWFSMPSFPLTLMGCLSSPSLELLWPAKWMADLCAIMDLVSSKAACTAISSVMSICFLASEKCFSNSKRKRWSRLKLTAPISGVPKDKLRRSRIVTVTSSLMFQKFTRAFEFNLFPSSKPWVLI